MTSRGGLWFRFLTSPVMVMFLVWAFSLLIYSFASTLGAEYSYFHFMVYQEGLVDNSGPASFLWLAIAFFSFLFGAVFFGFSVRNKGAVELFSVDFVRAIPVLLVFFICTAIVAAVWIGSAVIQVGGLKNLVLLAASENHVAREAVLSASFPGGRLVSSGFIGISVYSAALLGFMARHGYFGGAINNKILVSTIFVLAMIYLAVVPVLVSGRVNFFVAMLGSLVAYVYASGRVIGARYIFLGVFFLVVVWTAKQYFTMGHVVQDVSAFGQGFQAIIFYFYNDILNVLNTIYLAGEHNTFGWYSMRFVFFLTGTDKDFLRFIAEDFDFFRRYVSAGEVPLLGAPIVDFGAFGVLWLFMIGFISQYCYFLSKRMVSFVAIYGVIFACLVISVHSSFVTSQEIVYSVFVIFIMSKLSGQDLKRRYGR